MRSPLAGGAIAAAGTAALTALLAPFRDDVGLLNEGLLFLLLTVVISATWGRWPGVLAAVLSNLALNFFFVEPLYRFEVEGVRNAFGLAIFLIVSVLASSLLAAARDAAATARRRQGQTEALLDLSRAMIGQTEPRQALDALCSHALQTFAATGVAVLAQSDEGWEVISHAGIAEARRTPNQEERSMANRALQGGIEAVGQTRLQRRSRRIVSRGPTSRWRADSVVIVPLVIGGAAHSVMRLDRPGRLAELGDADDSLLRAFASEAAVTVQRLDLARAAAESLALKEADKAKTALIMSISHDLKTPLAGIKTSVSSLLDDSVSWTPEDRKAFLETIDSQADQLDAVISDILDLNRIESGAVRPLLRDAGALELLEDAVAHSRVALADHPVEIEAPPGLRAHVDASLVIQALGNLIDNAAKFSPPGAIVRLSATTAGDAVELAVEDEGPGVPAEDRPRVFERFYRARRDSSRVRGTGLGLSLVKALTELGGGIVRLDETASGSRFVLSFPAAGRMEKTA
jgi:two-component system sensor histidine kinase KdpD